MKKYDVCVMYWDGTKSWHKATPRYNIPHLIARSEARMEQVKPIYPKGTFVITVPNGKNPIEYLREKKLTPKPK